MDIMSRDIEYRRLHCLKYSDIQDYHRAFYNNRKYLTDNGIVDTPDKWGSEGDKRKPKWAKERLTYGFDERETWGMETTFYAWLYERLKMFVEVSNIQLDYHKFEFKGETYTQEQLINMMLERIEFYFKDNFNDCDKKQAEYVDEIVQIWAIVLPSMWW